MSGNEQQETYEAIMKLYDLAEELVHTVDSSLITDEEAHLMLIAPLVEQLADSADILVEEFTALAQQGEEMNMGRKRKMELALGKVFAVVEQCKKYNKQL